MMEVEAPWRCRRTDGKKWRCKRNVVSDHKYCDRHMYRGRLRSRKHVEQQYPFPPLRLFPSTNNNDGGGSQVGIRAGGVTITSSVAAAADTTDSRVSLTISNTNAVDFSPNSVLPVQRWTEDESMRCRRTGGKKWRCRRQVVSNQKYCDRHLHRGAKRRPAAAAASTSGGVLPPSTSQQLECSSKMLPRKDDNVSASSASSDATVSEVLLFH